MKNGVIQFWRLFIFQRELSIGETAMKKTLVLTIGVLLLCVIGVVVAARVNHDVKYDRWQYKVVSLLERYEIPEPRGDNQ